MGLQIIAGTDGSMDEKVIALALENSPSIIIDASNSANVHNFPLFGPEQFANVYVIEVEALYRLTTSLRKARAIANSIGTKNIFVTTFHLYNYGDEDEVKDIIIYAWELLSYLADEFNIVAAVEIGSIHEKLAKIHGAKEENMGHTLTSQRMIVDNIVSDLENFEKSLSNEDKEIYEKMLRQPLKHLGSITYTSSMNTWAIFLLCVMLEKEKEEIARKKEELQKREEENERMAYRQLQDGK